jgi:hypothetical protein
VRVSEFSASFRGFVRGRQRWLAGRWRVLLGLALLVVGSVELGLHFYFSRAAPQLKEWEAIRPAVEQLVDPETLVVIAPYWAEPNARFALGEQLMPLRHVARADESGFGRALEVSILGQEAPELSHWQLQAEQRLGRFLLRSWTNPQPRPVLYDFLEHVRPPDASVIIRRQGRPAECPFKAAKVSNGDLHGHPTYPRWRFVCPGSGEWSFVGSTVIEDQRYRPRACMWAHPAQRSVLELRFESVPIGAVIRGHGALPYLTERETQGTPIELSVHVAGELVGTWQHADGEGWKPFEFSTARFTGQQLPVEFRIQSRKALRREFCFQADVR